MPLLEVDVWPAHAHRGTRLAADLIDEEAEILGYGRREGV